MVTMPEELIHLLTEWHFKAHPKKMAAVYFSVEEVYDQTPDPEAAGKRIA